MDLTNETNNQENPKQLETLEEPGNKGASQTRSYDCNFCKRGFTNAQALGGHMNIHRKDKSKQQQTLNESIRRRSSSDISDNPHSLSSPNIPTNRKRQPLVVEPSSSCKLLRSTIKCSPGKNDTSSSGDASSGKDQTQVETIQQLPLFGDKYLGNKEDHYQNSSKEGEDEEGIEKGFSHKSHGLSSSEVDLELRLGPDPLPSLFSSKETLK